MRNNLVVMRIISYQQNNVIKSIDIENDHIVLYSNLIGSPTPYHIPTRTLTTSRGRLHRSTILSALGPDHNFLVGHPSWDCSRANLLNFGVLMEPEANELPKGLVLGRDRNIHIRHRVSTSLDDVGCYNPPPLGARHPRRHTSGHEFTLIPNCHIPVWAPTTSRARLHCSMILFASGPDHAFTVLFLGTQMRTSQWVTHHGIALARTRLTSEFRWNPKPMSSQKTSC
ncbi:unnamed protein product [Malus baccata var. baccata]